MELPALLAALKNGAFDQNLAALYAPDGNLTTLSVACARTILVIEAFADKFGTTRAVSLYHPHAELHHIKKENIGLIEVMGLAVLPVRLKEELAVVADALVTGADLRASELTEKHADWAESFSSKYEITAGNALEIVKK